MNSSIINYLRVSRTTPFKSVAKNIQIKITSVELITYPLNFIILFIILITNAIINVATLNDKSQLPVIRSNICSVTPEYQSTISSKSDNPFICTHSLHQSNLQPNRTLKQPNKRTPYNHS